MWRYKFNCFLVMVLLYSSCSIFSKENQVKESLPEQVKQEEGKGFFATVVDYFKTPRKTISNMSLPELERSKNALLAAGNKKTALKYAEQMMKKYKDDDDPKAQLAKLAEYMIELADLYFDTKDLEKAGTTYAEFAKLHPGHQKAEYALYKAIICSHTKELTIDRDQTKTKETLDLIEKFCERPLFAHYKKEVLEIQKECYVHLAKSELNVCNFLLSTNSFKGIENRINDMRKVMVCHVPEIEQMILSFESEVYAKQQELINAKPNRFFIRF